MPGHDVGQNAITALRSVSERGLPANFLAADRAYSSAKPENFQLPARALGYRPVFDYKVDQLGVRASWQGFVQIEGDWYCPAIPKALTDATFDLRKGSIDEPTYRARLAEREQYRARPIARPDSDGHVRLQCPASNPWPMAQCDLKPSSVRPETRGRVRIPVSASLIQSPPPSCTQQSVTIPPEAGAKFAQELTYGSDAWHAVYSTLRNTNEGIHGFVKDGAHEALDDPRRRRLLGVAAQSIIVAFLLMAANVRKIEAFHNEVVTSIGPTRRRPPRRRLTKPIDTWRPGTPDTQVLPGHDPPLTA
jgi:hypothetical protein